jgi:hypothetical protein
MHWSSESGVSKSKMIDHPEILHGFKPVGGAVQCFINAAVE